MGNYLRERVDAEWNDTENGMWAAELATQAGVAIGGYAAKLAINEHIRGVLTGAELTFVDMQAMIMILRREGYPSRLIMLSPTGRASTGYVVHDDEGAGPIVRVANKPLSEKGTAINHYCPVVVGYSLMWRLPGECITFCFHLTLLSPLPLRFRLPSRGLLSSQLRQSSLTRRLSLATP